ncbi:MAG: L-seryl-tRNA(Sec) selenium transferase [Gammaproteobacteria bacterium]|jgi:L-seryl-tRNA(Ser) seleniumtransferase|nr:L-seryl-tRNA(Sec) selenium transferase [Gammaproteobacteria bacterium]|tara:strand:+ start:2311 stop:3708 length:1398 start_codon:yes stop_codon:yes gene_type:complete
MNSNRAFAQIPSVDRVISSEACQSLVAKYGRSIVTSGVRAILASIRSELSHSDKAIPSVTGIVALLQRNIDEAHHPSLKPVLNLTGTVLHTNLGRASLPEVAISGMVKIARGPSNLEYDLESGKRGDRDDHLERAITGITGAEAATVVNNNAAAVLITLNTLAREKEVPVSRGELVEIGGSFRIPEIMQQSGCELVEVGATNRTHLKDYQQAISEKTALLMKVHTSNYEIKGFTSSVTDKELAELADSVHIPFVTDLGSGTMVDLSPFGLPHEPTAQEAIQAGAHIVTFSGDKLLGGPQAGIIVGKKNLIAAIKANPLKRALRIDKMTMVALAEVLNLYRDPDRLCEQVPTLRYLARSVQQIEAVAKEVLPPLVSALSDHATVDIVDTQSQIGSGSLPLELLPSKAIRIQPGKPSDQQLQQIAKAFRHLPTPVIGRIHDGKLLFDLRTLEQSADLVEQLSHLDYP